MLYFKNYRLKVVKEVSLMIDRNQLFVFIISFLLAGIFLLSVPEKGFSGVVMGCCMNCPSLCTEAGNQTDCEDASCGNFVSGGLCDDSTLCPNNCAVPPANDDCINAGTISDGCTAFSDCSATTDGPPNNLCFISSDNQIHNDLWYQYTATCTGNLTVSTCTGGSDTMDFDTKLAVYNTTDCGQLTDTDMTILACNDDAGCGVQGHRAEVTVPVVFGQMYLIRVGKFDDSRDGTADLCISCGGFGPGTEKCGEAQQACLDAVNALGPMPKKGDAASACAHAANEFPINEECHDCIESAVASKKKEGTNCGPEM